MLYPRASESRDVLDLSGIWEFKADAAGRGRREKWFAAPLSAAIPMPVPASYNDITQDAALRDHIGDVWYQRAVFAPAAWRGRRVALRVDSATHHAVVWVNGREVVRHKGGYLPFEADVSAAVRFGAENLITIAVNNELDSTCIPPGSVRTDKHAWGRVKHQQYAFDFFNYAGLHRPVRLCATPRVFIRDATVVTDIRGTDGIVDYRVELGGGRRRVAVRLRDADGREAAAGEGASGRLRVKRARLWAPGAPYLYTLEIRTLGADGAAEDVYRLPVGIRTVAVRGKRFLINGEPFYFTGCCKHEDADLRGKGLDAVTNVKDFNLLKWMGANSVRTSHYPYAEEFLDLADREGIAVIDESPAVGLWDPKEFFTGGAERAAGLRHHLDVMRELVARDKNHPCVVMWSVANEPSSHEKGARPYFRKVVETTRRCDPTRPVTLVMCRGWDQEQAGDLLDVICVNRYNAWYWYPGRLDMVEPSMRWELKRWYKRFRKPVLLSEFGADTIAGFHNDPPVIFSEEFQREFYDRYGRVLDGLDFIIGEHVWNFADFLTQQGVTRVGGNRKGVFTRQRQPKMAAHWLRERWTKRRG